LVSAVGKVVGGTTSNALRTFVSLRLIKTHAI
jgi:hypothetical protein